MTESGMVELLHKFAIRDLAECYAQAVDRRDFERLALLLTDDCSICSEEFSLHGRDAIVQGLQSGLTRFESTMHCVSNQLVILDHEGATAETYCVAHHIYRRGDEMRKLSWGIRYQDELLLQNNEWRFAGRELLIDWRQDLALEQSI